MIRPFKAEDMMALLADGIMECGITTTGNEALETLSHEREANGRGYSYFIDGHIAGCISPVDFPLTSAGSGNPSEPTPGMPTFKSSS